MGIVKKEILTIAQFIQNQHLSIPHFQRPYKWSAKNVIQLLDDIQRFKKTPSYRIGTIVIFQEKDKSHIVDGQQRTVSFLLIIKALLKIKYQDLQDVTLKKLLTDIEKDLFEPTFKNDESLKNIQLNYREIERRITNLDETFIQFFLNQCEITHFVIDDISEAFQFFDSQNARGKDLEPHDLLKAFHLRELETSNIKMTEEGKATLVETWEDMDTRELSSLFADFLFRVRGWSKGNSSRYFTKKNTPLFKGINLGTTEPYPYTQIFKVVDEHLNNGALDKNFPFQLDQTIINGQYFFEMISHYKKAFDNMIIKEGLTNEAEEIIDTINSYGGKKRTGDMYVRMLFNCALLYYVDKFGEAELSKAIEKLFIWAYTPRLQYHSLQLASVDNYVLDEYNIFKKIREAINKEEIITLELPLITDEHLSDKTTEIRELFLKMKYYANPN